MTVRMQDNRCGSVRATFRMAGNEESKCRVFDIHGKEIKV